MSQAATSAKRLELRPRDLRLRLSARGLDVSRETVSRWLAGRGIDPAHLAHVAEALELSPAEAVQLYAEQGCPLPASVVGLVAAYAHEEQASAAALVAIVGSNQEVA